MDEAELDSLDVAIDPHEANLLISEDAVTIRNVEEDCCVHHDCCGEVDDCDCAYCKCEAC